MKETSLRQTRRLFRHQAAERKLNRIFSVFIIQAGLAVCLFLFPASGNAQDWQFTPQQKEAYRLVLDLRLNDARQIVSSGSSPADLYIISLADVIELLITEDPEKFQEYEKRFDDRISLKRRHTSAADQFVDAEMRLQWSYVYLKFGKELDAASSIRSAYHIAENCRRKNPKFLPIRKTTGLLSVMVGSVPEKYDWLLSLLGMEGSIASGLRDLELIAGSGSDLADEVQLLHALISTFVLQKPEEGVTRINDLRRKNPESKLLTFFAAAIAVKNSQSEYALSLLVSPTLNDTSNLVFSYTQYLTAEAYLHQASYEKAIGSYKSFIAGYRGKNYLKDSYYKIGLCHWLNGSGTEAQLSFAEARRHGTEASEADKHAARSLESTGLPNIPLSKVRYFTDGGYYQQATSTLASITPEDLPTKKDQAEFYYRRARLAHKQLQYSPAKLFYIQTIAMCENESWYFAPNATLQLGYIALAENRIAEAKKYFTKALEFKKHEYKNSIDTKARSALSQLKTR
jgi:hypothetical protein